MKIFISCFLFRLCASYNSVSVLVEQATDNSASAANLALHLQICDEINNSDSGSVLIYNLLLNANVIIL